MRRIFVSLLCFSWLVSPAVAATRLAVLEVDSPQLAKVATLLEIELLKLPDTEALERAQIGEILKEQKLQMAFAADAAAQRMTLGKVLKADVLIFLQIVEKPEPHGILLAFETKNGLRLQVAPFELSSNAEKDAQSILPQVQQALERLRGEIREIVAVPPLVSTDLAFERQALGKPLAAVIEQMLLSRPGVAVVELAEANALANEILLTGSDGVMRKLPLYLLGEYRYDGYGPEARMTIALSLKRGESVLDSQTFKNVVPDEAATTVRREAATLFDKISESKLPVPDPAAEAKQLAERATLMYRLSVWRECLELAEASLLLKPDQVELQRLAATAGILQIRQDSRAALEEAKKASPPIRGADFVPPAKLQEELRDAHMSLALRILPRFEYYLTHAKLRYSEDTFAWIASFFNTRANIDEQQRQLFVRVLRAKQAAKVQDDTVLFVPYCQQWCFENATEAEKLQWKYDMAEAWPINTKGGSKQNSLEAMLIKGVDRNDSQLFVMLDKLKTMKNPAAQQAAANIQRRLDNDWHLLFDRPVPMVPSPEPRPSLPRDETAEVKFIPTGATGLHTGEIRGWIPSGPGIDALWNENQLFFLGDKSKLEGLGDIRINAFYSRQACCFDGRFTWAYHSAGQGKPELLVVEPAKSRIERITVEQGMPPIDLDSISMTALGEGSVCIIGHFGGRAWIGLGRFDAATGKGSLSVIHEARELPKGQSDAAWKNPNTAFASSCMFTLTGPEANGTKPQRIFVYRYGTKLPLFIDPVTRKLEVASWSWNVYNLGGVIQHEGSIYWIGNIKNWTAQDWRVHRLGYSSAKPEVYTPQAPPFGNLFRYGKHVGAIGQNLNRSIWITDTWDGKFRELRTDPQDKASFNSSPQYFQSEHFGTVAMKGTLSYKVELLAAAEGEKQAEPKAEPTAPPKTPDISSPSGEGKTKK